MLIPIVFRSVKGLQGANDKFQKGPRIIPEGHRKEETLHSSFVM